jgi:hypothetical protein
MNVRTSQANSGLSQSGLSRFLGVVASLAAAAGLVLGCSSSTTPGLGTNISSAAITVPVLITDAPSDQLVSFSLTLNSIVLTDTAGNTASILPSATTIEICHLNGVQAPLVTASIPADTYTSATFTFSNPAITYINSSGVAVVATPTLTTTTYKLTFPTPITVSNSSTSLLVDLLAGQSVNISGTTVTVTPIFSLKPLPAASAVPPTSQNGTGMQQMATVVSVSGTSVVLQPGSGADFTVTTNSSTLLQGFSSLSALTAGELVQVDFIVQSGGVYLATRIQLVTPTPTGQPPVNLLSGPVTKVSTGSFNMVLMQGLGPAVAPTATAAASVFTVTDTGATFAITPQFVSLAGLPFTPTFTAANLVAGQAVGVVASSVTGSTAVASNVYLVPQTIGGTVTAVATSGSWTAYTLTLNSGSAFSSLSGATTVTVYTNTATAPPPGVTAPPAIVAGSAVRFNGLIFNTGSGFAMVAGCSPDGAPGV